MVRAFSRSVAVCVFLLLIAGALVTSTESGLAVPDWPLSYGQLMPPMVGGIFYEHGHRMVAAAVSTLVGLQMGALLLLERRRALRRLGVAAFAAILAQAVLGGLTVLFLLPPAVSSAHAALAEIVFALCATIALLSSRTFGEDAGLAVRQADAASLEKARALCALAAAATLVQIVLGAVMRHTGAGLSIPDFPLSFGGLWPSSEELGRPGVAIHLSHRVGAVVVAAVTFLAARQLRRLAGVSAFFSRLSTLWLLALTLQVVLGGFSIWTRKAVPITTAHLAVGALCWVSAVLGAVAAGVALSRLGARSPARAAGVPEALTTPPTGATA